jgi:hypothetical protein
LAHEEGEITVFISCNHDTLEHTQRVLQLANALRGQGVDVELDQYLVRPPLGAAILVGLALDQLDPCRESLQHAVDGLRRAGMQGLPLGLLTRACLRILTGARAGPESARSDLDEAWEIAERGPMPLHMADILLYRARFFGAKIDRRATRERPRKTTSPGRGGLIEKHGYWRRKEELEDAEAAALAVPDNRRVR